MDNFDLSTDIHNPHVREMRTVFPMKNKKRKTTCLMVFRCRMSFVGSNRRATDCRMSLEQCSDAVRDRLRGVRDRHRFGVLTVAVAHFDGAVVDGVAAAKKTKSSIAKARHLRI